MHIYVRVCMRVYVCVCLHVCVRVYVFSLKMFFTVDNIKKRYLSLQLIRTIDLWMSSLNKLSVLLTYF